MITPNTMNFHFLIFSSPADRGDHKLYMKDQTPLSSKLLKVVCTIKKIKKCDDRRLYGNHAYTFVQLLLSCSALSEKLKETIQRLTRGISAYKTVARQELQSMQKQRTNVEKILDSLEQNVLDDKCYRNKFVSHLSGNGKHFRNSVPLF